MPRKKKNATPKMNVIEAWNLVSACADVLSSFLAADAASLAAERSRLVVRRAVEAFAAKPKKRCSSKRDPAHAAAVANVGYKFVGYPNPEQEAALKNNIGGSRFMWNRLKSDRDELYKQLGVTVKPTPADYKDVEGLEWLDELDSYALCNVQLNLEKAYFDWFAGLSGAPRFKKKGLAKASYTTNKDKRCDNVKLEGDMLTLPKIPGAIRLKVHRPIREGAVLKSCTVTLEPTGRWTFSLLYEYVKEERPDFNDALATFFATGDASALKHVGLDMSLPHMFVDSDGKFPSYVNDGSVVEFDKHYRRLEKRIAKEQRRLSRMVRGSRNHEKQCVKIAKLHAKAKRQRHDFIEQLSARLARAYDVISVEDLDVAAMKKSLRFGKSVSDNGWGEFLAALERKCQAAGSLLLRVDKWFPSSRTCSRCGYVNAELKLSDRTYVCPKCGRVMDRDHQAAINIDREGMSILMEYYKGGAAARAA